MQLLRAIDGYRGHPVTALALKLAPLVFVRPGELRGAEWSEFDWVVAEWRIPATRMKMGRLHVVPLSKQALAILSELRPLVRGGRLVFPSIESRDRPMSDNTITAGLRRLGYTTDEQTGHGFRSTASTHLNEMGFPCVVIELQLAHTERNRVRVAYNKAQRLAERRAMMQHWADYLGRLKEVKEVQGILETTNVAPATSNRINHGGRDFAESFEDRPGDLASLHAIS